MESYFKGFLIAMGTALTIILAWCGYLTLLCEVVI